MSVSFEEQLSHLDRCGIRLLPEVTVTNLLAAAPRDVYEKDPYVRLLCTLGAELDVEPFCYPSDDIWHFDTECIEDHNDYVRIAQRFVDLAGDALPLEDICDYVDIDAGEAWLSFELDGKAYKWTAAVENDWVDPMIISRFAKLLAERKAQNRFLARFIGARRDIKRFTYLDLKGQDCLFGCSTEKELTDLRSATGLDFMWLR
jgi:hypothetical protein